MAAAATDPHSTARGPVLLLEHCAAIERLDVARPRAVVRLEEAVGSRLTRLLLGALVGDHAASSRELVG
jgi:hypothetical protein